MSTELDILKIVAENPHLTQRKISEKAGISLGQVNFLIKKCVKKGLIKIEGQNSKSLRYNLTPKGFAEKAEKTLKYIKISYTAVLMLTDRIRALAKEYVAEGYDLYVYGSQDEMQEIVKSALHDFNAKYLIAVNELDQKIMNSKLESTAVVVFYWEADKIIEIEKWKAVNILE